MTQGELEKLAQAHGKIFSDLEIRIMDDIVRRIKINGFSTASADWQMTRLRQLGKSEEDIKEWIRMALDVSEEELERIYSDEVYEQYMGHQRAYVVNGMKQIAFEDNAELQQLVTAIMTQTKGTFENITASMGFVKQDAAGKLQPVSLTDYYRQTLDSAVMDIHSGAFDYNTVLKRTIEEMTRSGIRQINYASGRHDRIDVAARRAVMTGFRQVQGKINEQVANDLGTDYYEVTYHVGARPEHQPWQGKVWSMQQLREVCGLGTVTGLHGANCYHDYNAFIPGVSVRTYTDEQLNQMLEQENTPKTYLGKEYTTYEALQHQRKLERTMRKYRQDIKLMQDGDADPEIIMLKRARYHGKMQEYEAFSKKMALPMKKDRIYQDGLKGRFDISEKQYMKVLASKTKKESVSKMDYERRKIRIFQKADDIKKATEFAKNNLGIQHVYYKNLDVRTANDMNAAITDGMNYAPDIVKRMNFIGSMQIRNTEFKKKLITALDEDLRKVVPGRSTDYYERYSKQLAGQLIKPVRSNVFATAFPGGDLGIGYPKATTILKEYSGIGVNASFGSDYEQFLKSIKRNVISGYHPEGTDTVRAIFDHEVAHQIDYVLNLRYNKEMLKLYQNLTEDEIKHGLSKYATENIAEFIAEGYTEYKNNPRSRDIAKKIGEIIEAVVKGGK